MRQGLVALIIVTLLASCGGERPESLTCNFETPVAASADTAPAAVLRSQPAATVRSADTSADQVAANLTRLLDPVPRIRLQRQRQRQEINFLAVSTGGQWAAFGAGFLSGWSDNTAEPLPDFQLATGASAGAYVAPFAVLGEAYRERLNKFRGIDNEGLVRQNPLFGLFGASVFRVDGLKRLVDETLGPQGATDLVAAGNDKKAVLVGAVDLDTTAFRFFDLTRIAAQENGSDCVTEAILSSSAIPIVFPPRSVNGGLLSDSGLRNHVFLDGAQALIDQAAQRGIDLRVNLYIIINGDLRLREAETGYSVLDVAGRAFEIANDDGLRASILSLLEYSGRRNWTVRAVTGRDVDISECYETAEGPSAPFDGCVTTILFDEGQRMAKAGRIEWLTRAELQRLAEEYN